jgi:histidinol-phosphate/aromatic aminotransferase/cobyric acid decarboxylase-like protein
VIPRPGRHGGDGARVAAALGLDPAAVLDLSQSLNPFAPDVTEIVGKHLDGLRRYPDPAAAHGALASAMNVDPARLVLTNGGSEAIAMVAAELGGGVASEPEFGLHPRAAHGPRWRSDPHNPTGALADENERADVWDEAFYPLATGLWTAGREGWVVGSLTKLLACPGLRAGYVLAPDAGAAAAIAARQPAWSVNGLVADALPDLLATVDLPATTAAISAARVDLDVVLRAAGFAPEPSRAPWLLVRAPGLRRVLAPRGIVVRDCASFGLTDHVRIAVPDRAGLARLEEALCGAG